MATTASPQVPLVLSTPSTPSVTFKATRKVALATVANLATAAGTLDTVDVKYVEREYESKRTPGLMLKTHDRIETPRQLHRLLDNEVCERSARSNKIISRSSEEPSAENRRIYYGNQVSTYDNGFFASAFHCYNKHYRWVIRPDDVWLAIMVQLSIYINANGEALRHMFVAHEGQIELKVYMEGNMYQVHYPLFARLIVEKIREHVKTDFIDFATPDFSTTTEQDITISSFVTMAQMQKYFSYTCICCCGIPEITLEGTLEDWEKLRTKVARLVEFEVPGTKDKVMATWTAMLGYVLNQFVEAYKGNVNEAFWERVMSKTPLGSGGDFRLTGWITAFGAFKESGKFIGVCEEQGPGYRENRRHLLEADYALDKAADSMAWPSIENAMFSPGVVSVPLKIIDLDESVHKTSIVAGHFSFEADAVTVEPSSGIVSASAFRPRTDWIIVEIDEAAVEAAKKADQ